MHKLLIEMAKCVIIYNGYSCLCSLVHVAKSCMLPPNCSREGIVCLNVLF